MSYVNLANINLILDLCHASAVQVIVGVLDIRGLRRHRNVVVSTENTKKVTIVIVFSIVRIGPKRIHLTNQNRKEIERKIPASFASSTGAHKHDFRTKGQGRFNSVLFISATINQGPWVL